MLHIRLKGTPRERGRQHGEALRADIRNVLDTWIAPFARKPASPEVPAMRRFLEKNFPRIVEEIQGIGEGAGIPPEQAFLLNVFNSCPAFLFDPGCTSLAIRGTKGGFLVGKTQDTGPEEALFQTVIEAEDEHGRRAAYVGLAGTVWVVAGVNDRGLAVGCNSAPPPASTITGHGLPQHMGYYPVLWECADVPDAVHLLERNPFTGKGINAILADARGEAAAVEKVDGWQAVVRSRERTLWLANFYRSPSLSPLNDPTLSWAESTRDRERHLARRVGDLAVENPESFLVDLFAERGFPGCLCQDIPERGLVTYYGFLMDPKARTLSVSDGRPDGKKYTTYAAK